MTPWRLGVGALVGVVGLAGLAASSTAARASAAGGERTALVQQLCPGTVAVYPPLGASNAQSSAYYGVPIASEITGGTLDIGTVVKTTGLSATICGLLRFPQLTASIPGQVCNAATEAAGCFSYGQATTSIDGLVDLPTTISPGPATVTVLHTTAPDGGLEIDIAAQVTTHVHIARFGVDCSVGPIDLTLTTATSGPLSGAPVTGPLYDATAKIVSAAFAVPGANASLTCPAGLVPATDQLVGLPAAPGVALFSAPMTLANSLQ